MPPRGSKPALKPKIPDIPWGQDKSSLVWDLLAEIEKEENYRVLFGKKDVSEVSTTITHIFRLSELACMARTRVERPKSWSIRGLLLSSCQTSLALNRALSVTA
jgi:hypothetical protein